jgi:hypothetical protein
MGQEEVGLRLSEGFKRSLRQGGNAVKLRPGRNQLEMVDMTWD